MREAKRWTVIVDVDRRGGHPRALARLFSRENDRFIGVGTGWRDPARGGRAGEEVRAAGRALADLGAHLAEHARDVRRAVPFGARRPT